MSRNEDIASRPLPTRHFASVRDFLLDDGAVYVHGGTDGEAEERARHVAPLRERCPGASFVRITAQTRDDFTYLDPAGSARTVALRGPAQLKAFWAQSAGGGSAYLDITGLTHPVMAALVKSAFVAGVRLQAVYVEPRSYKYNAIDHPSGDIFGLSKEYRGLAALPGFLTLEVPEDPDRWRFVPLLGFEGRRFTYIREKIAPDPERTVPVVGVPGYRPEFVGAAYHGNQEPLVHDDAYMRVKRATANCPFALYDVLAEILALDKDGFLRVAPIGTRPHALGAVLFALAHPEQVEILYDHPIEDPLRSAGEGRLLVFDVSTFDELVGNAVRTGVADEGMADA